MDYDKKLKEEISKFHEFYETVCKRADASKNLVDQAYRHEARTIIGRLQNAEDLKNLGKEGEEISNKILKTAYENELPHLKDLEKLVKMGDLTKEQIFSDYSNFYEIMKRQENIHKEYLDSKNITYNTFGESQDIQFHPGVASTLISTLYGNSVKWAPQNTEINQKIKNKEKKTIIRIENQFGETPENKEIGENKGIGTLFVNTILEKVKGSIQYYTEPKLKNTNDEVYGVKITIPKK